MFSSIALSVAFTVTFIVTGGYALVGFALLTAEGDRGGDRLVELSHLLMSVAMVAMAWGAGTGGPARTLQIVVFGGFGVWFLRLAVLGRGGSGHGRLPDIDHAVTAAAMVWMVAAMPVIMGMSMTASGGGAGGHAGHGGHGSGGAAGSAMAGMSGMAVPTPAWVVGVTVAFVALLAVGAVFWAVRAWRGGAVSLPEPVRVDDSGRGGTAVAVQPRTAVARSGLAALTGPRLDALSHVLMSAAMAAMLLAML